RTRATGSLDLEVLRGSLSTVLDEFELNGLAFIQRAKACALDCGDVNEHILPAFLRLNEAVAFRRIEPLNGALRHACSPEVLRTLRTNRASLAQSGTAAKFFSAGGRQRQTHVFSGIWPSRADWCRVRELNPRPTVYKTAALPLS